jgi:hypothetical protein
LGYKLSHQTAPQTATLQVLTTKHGFALLCGFWSPHQAAPQITTLRVKAQSVSCTRLGKNIAQGEE